MILAVPSIGLKLKTQNFTHKWKTNEQRCPTHGPNGRANETQIHTEIQRYNEWTNHHPQEKWCELSRNLNSASTFHSFLSHTVAFPQLPQHIIFILSLSLLRIYCVNIDSRWTCAYPHSERSRIEKNWQRREEAFRAWHAVPECIVFAIVATMYRSAWCIC